MGDIFRREVAEHPEPFTGERLTAAVGGQVRSEHYHRYLFARALVSGCDVLDVASGEGYGAALLAQVARRVVGVEYAGATARAAAGSFARPNLHFVAADARALPLADGCVDAVVSFETIEHFDRQEGFLREIRRVLRPGGLCIVSTPNRDVYSPPGSAANPFHVCELTDDEFAALLQRNFRHVRLLRQRALIGSAVLADGAAPMAAQVFERRGDTHFEACIGLPRAPYLLAVASDSEPPPLPPSLYIERGDLDTETLRIIHLAQQLQQAQAELRAAEQRAEQAESRAERAESRAEQAESRAGQAASRAGQAEQRAEQAEQRAEQTEQARMAVEAQYASLQGSLRTFLRGYWPRLRSHLAGRSR